MLNYKKPEDMILQIKTEVEANSDIVKENTSNGVAVGSGLREEGYTAGEEKALVRKAIYHLLVKLNLINEPEFAEFIKYHETAEEIKKELKEGGMRNA